MKTIVTILFFATVSSAFAKPYYRFWRGHIEPSMSEKQFVKGLNDLFIPETVEQGRGHGIIGYMPVMVSRSENIKEFPDEMALVVYESEKKYREIRRMPRGADYQRLHWDYFDRKTSRSLVPVEYKGKVETEKAYDLLESDAVWRKGKVQYLLRKFKGGFNQENKKELEDYLNFVKEKAKDLEIKSHLVLVDRLGVHEYVLYEKNQTKFRLEALLDAKKIKTSMNIILKNKNQNVDFGEGVNRQFSLTR